MNEPDKALAGQVWQTLYRWQEVCFRAANTISASHLFAQEQLPQMSYLADAVQRNLADLHKQSDGLLNTSRINSTLRLLSRQYKGQIPIHILGRLNLTLHREFGKKRPQYLQGEKAIASFRRGTPMPIPSEDIRLACKLQQKAATTSASACTNRSFSHLPGLRHPDKPLPLQQVLKGELRLCDSHLQVHDKQLFLLAAFERPLAPQALNGTVIAEVSLSPETPVLVRIAGKRYAIGDKEEFFYRRLALQQARQRLQAAATTCRGRHGRMLQAGSA